MKRIILLLSVISTINLISAQVDNREAAELYVNFAEDTMELNNASEKSVDEAIISLEKAVEIDTTYGEAYSLLGFTIITKINYITWNSKVKKRRGKSDFKSKLEIRKLYFRAKDVFVKAIYYGEDSREIEDILRIINFELIGDRIKRRQIGIE